MGNQKGEFGARSATRSFGAGKNDLAPRSGAAKTLGEEVYSLLRRDILSGMLPPGSHLPLRQLAQRYSCGIAPLREALSRLVSERLVHFEGQRGYAVVPVSLEELKDLCSLRIELSVSALRISIERGDTDWEANIVAALHRLLRLSLPTSPPADAMIQDWERRHESFHESLIAACNSPWRLHFSSMLSDQFARYRHEVLIRMTASEQLSQKIDQEHRDIAQAAVERDTERAVRLLAEHFRGTFEQFVALYPLCP